MTSPPDVKSLFGRAAELPPADRPAFLDRACADHPAVRSEVEALLSAIDRAGSFMGVPAAPGETGDYTPIAEGEGTVIGPYTLREQIGEGGFGLVFVAEQEYPVRRKVALKIVKPGMDTRQVVARFEAERQALAMMDHPNIAKILDAGATAAGRPFFVMELVKGIPVTEYADAHNLTPRDRLGLFVQVCRAVQHAHQKGVIHRDLKPSNILVAPHDGVPVVKVIDFGVAKALGQRLTDKTIYTRFFQMIGTPLYMSPEQAEVNQLDVDTRSDVYSLGVLLYELLTGTTPFDRERFQTAAFDEIRRIIKEEEPPRPSTRLTSLGDTLAAVSAYRGTDPGRLAGLVRGDLDWIVMRCLEKDRGRRYESAAALARDVERHLNGDAVEACPPSVRYRLNRFARRHSAAIVIALVYFGTLKVATMISIWLASRAMIAETMAEQQRDEALVLQAKAIEAQEAATRERDWKAAALQKATGQHLMLRSELVRPTNPGLALTLAVEGARRDPGLFANNTLTAALADCREQRTLIGHQGVVQACAFSPDGLRVVTGGADKTARVWDAAGGKELLALRDHDRPVVYAAYSPDGQRILTVATSRNEYEYGTEAGQVEPVTARLWEAATGRLVATWQDPPAAAAGKPHYRLVTLGASFSPDGRRVVTTYGVYPDGTTQVRDTATGQLIYTLDGHKEPVTAVAFSPDGKWIATASTDRTAILWDAETGKPVHTVKHPLGIGRVAFSPDGKRLLTIGNGLTLSRFKTPDGEMLGGEAHDREDTAGRVWDTATGKELAALKWPDGGKTTCYSGAFSPDGKRILTANQHYLDHFGPNGFPWVWDAATGTPLVREIGRDPERATAAVALFSPDTGSRWVLTVTDRTAYLRDSATGKTRAAYRGHEDTIRATAFSPDGRRVVTAGADGTARLWDVDLGPDAAARLGVWPTARGAAISLDGRALVELPTGRLWDLAAGREVTTLPGHKGEVSHAAFAADGSKLLTVSFDHAVRVWDPRTGDPLAVLTGHTSYVKSAEFNPAGTRIATAAQDGTARVWDAVTGRELARFQKTERTKTNGTLNDIEQFVGGVSFSPDGKHVVGNPATSANWVAGVWDAETGAEVQTLRFPPDHTGNNHSARFLPDGRVLTQQPAGVWAVDTARMEVSLRHPDLAPDVVAASPDGRFVATGDEYDRRVLVYDATTGRVVHTLSGHADGIGSLAFSRAGDRLVSGSKDGTARVWDVATGQERLTLPHPGVTAVGFTPDGRQVVTAGRGVRLWPIDPLTAANVKRPRDLTTAERAKYGLEP